MKDVSNYLTILEESLTKKVSVLQALLEACRRQTELAEADAFDLDAFEATLDEKDALLNQLEELDHGFHSVFQEIETEVKQNRDRYAANIQALQQLIRKCTDMSVEIQAVEERNKAKLEVKFATQQKELRQIKTTSKVASTYYKSMSNTQTADSYFLDQKK